MSQSDRVSVIAQYTFHISLDLTLLSLHCIGLITVEIWGGGGGGGRMTEIF